MTRSTKPYDDRAWKETRSEVLNEARDDKGIPRCAGILGRTCKNEATEVNHKITVRKRPDLRLDKTNLEPLCGTCHKQITILNDGALGHKPGAVRLKGADENGIPADPRHHWN